MSQHRSCLLGWMCLCVCAGVLACASSVCAQVRIASSPISRTLTDPAETHAWVVMRLEDGGASPDAKPALRSIGVFHLPPRGEVKISKDRTLVNPPGRVELVARLNTMPTWISAWEREVFLVFEPESFNEHEPEPTSTAAPKSETSTTAENEQDGAHPQRVVLASRVQILPYGNTWVRENARRFRAMQSLPGTGSVLGFAATHTGLCALLTDLEQHERAIFGQPPRPRNETELGRDVLLCLVDSRWESLGLPDGWAVLREKPIGDVSLLAGEQGPMLVAHTDSQIHWWTWETTPGQSRAEGNWSLAHVVDDAPARTDTHVFSLMGRPALLVRTPAGKEDTTKDDTATVDSNELRVWTGDAFLASATLGTVPSQGKITAMDGNSSVVVAWEDETAKTDRSPMVLELSTQDGRETYRGESRQRGPIARWEMQLAVLVLVLLTIASLLIALRPEPKMERTQLPAGRTRATRLQRLVAGAFDVVIVSISVNLVQDIIQQLHIVVIEDGGMLWASLSHLLFVAIVGFVYCTITETIFGKTLGKVSTACEVVRLVDDPAKPAHAPGLAASAMRNGVRWLCPPVAIAGLMSARVRHRGGMISQTDVVVRDMGLPVRAEFRHRASSEQDDAESTELDHPNRSHGGKNIESHAPHEHTSHESDSHETDASQDTRQHTDR